MTVLVKFPPEQQSLLAEIQRHPDLRERLKAVRPTDISEWYGTVAAHCGIVLDGMYHPGDFLNLARMLTDALYVKRTSLVITSKENNHAGQQ